VSEVRPVWYLPTASGCRPRRRSGRPVSRSTTRCRRGAAPGRGGRLRVGPDLRGPGILLRRPGRGPRRAAAAAGPSCHRRRAARRGAGPAPGGGQSRSHRDRGISATIGRSDAVIQLPFGVKLRGLVAWWLGGVARRAAGGRTQPGGDDGQPRGPLPHVAACAQRHRGRPTVARGRSLVRQRSGGLGRHRPRPYGGA
jgi:hypothetical protein